MTLKNNGRIFDMSPRGTTTEADYTFNFIPFEPDPSLDEWLRRITDAIQTGIREGVADGWRGYLLPPKSS